MTTTFAPFVIETLWARLVAIADEAATALVRTSFSPTVRESKDFACVLMDTAGKSLAQNTSTVPSFVGVLPRTMQHILERYPLQAWKPEDVVITNDPWLATGHFPDVTLVMPIFSGNELVAFAGAIAHMPDIGGRIYSADATELYEEGLNIPITRFHEAGVPNRDLIEIIRTNVRVPDLTMGDLHSQIACCKVMGRRLIEMMTERKLASLSALADEIHARSDRAMRTALEKIPDGVYNAETVTDLIDGKRVKICVSITIKGDTVHCDYTGTSEQVRRGINAVYNCTYAHTAYYLKCVLDPDLPNNEGALRCLTVSVPEGSILNPRRPAPVNARQIILHYLPAVVLEALAKALPGRVIAQSGAPSNRTFLAGERPDGSRFSVLLFTSGGLGARPDRDGLACTSFPTNTGAASVEVLENTLPVVFLRKSLTPDSGGSGRWRGGLGQTLQIESVSRTPVTASFLMDRVEIAPRGMNGGGDGALAKLKLLNRPAELPPKGRFTLEHGDVIEIQCPGGGGYGPPEARRPDLIDRDQRFGYITSRDGGRQ